MFGCQFMPRFTRLNEKANKNLVAFDNLQNYKDFLIKPSEIANKVEYLVGNSEIDFELQDQTK